jgi:hypothetical protein
MGNWQWGTPMLAIVAGVVTACASPGLLPAARPAGAATAAARSPQPYQLYTHCGIDEARLGNRYFEAVDPLSDGAGNPPPGWGNPYQAGTITLVSPTEAVFRDAAGHRVLFRLRPGATGFRHVCS